MGNSFTSSSAVSDVEAVLSNIQVAAESGQTLYAVIMSRAGLCWNTLTEALETKNTDNWAGYAIELTETVAGSGIYFGTVPSSLGDDTYLLPVYVQDGDDPASSDDQAAGAEAAGLTLVLDWVDSAVKSIAPLPHSKDSRPVAIPQPQNSAAYIQGILSDLYAAQASLATEPYASITIDGESVSFTSPAQVAQQITFWERKLAFVTGRRRRVNPILLG